VEGEGEEEGEDSLVGEEDAVDGFQQVGEADADVAVEGLIHKVPMCT